MRYIIYLVMYFSMSTSIYAKKMTNDLYQKVEFKYRLLQEAKADTQSIERAGFGFGFDFPLLDRFSIENTLMVQQEPRKQPRKLKVRNNWLSLYSGVNWSYPALFRWFIQPGIVLQYEKIDTTFQDKSTTNSQTSLFPFIAIGADYSFNDFLEFQAELGLQKRSNAQNTDWFWSLGLSYNLIPTIQVTRDTQRVTGLK